MPAQSSWRFLPGCLIGNAVGKLFAIGQSVAPMLIEPIAHRADPARVDAVIPKFTDVNSYLPPRLFQNAPMLHQCPAFSSTRSRAMIALNASYPRQSDLAVALREVGRIERTLFIIDWILDADMQRRAQIGLNKGEAHHALNRYRAWHSRKYCLIGFAAKAQAHSNGCQCRTATLSCHTRPNRPSSRITSGPRNCAAA